jgi:DNA polymerase-1
MNPIQKQGYDLLHAGALAFAQAERAGIHVNVEYCKEQQKILEDKENELQAKIFDSKAGKLWKKQYGSRTKLGSADQLKFVLRKHFDIIVEGSTDQDVLNKINIPFTRCLIKYKKINVARVRYLKNIMQETTDGVCHPSYNLHLVSTFRSSCMDPNFQNMPIRDPQIAKIIRSAFIPRKDHCIIEADFKTLEVGVGACYHLDPTMLKELESGYDMHLEMASKIFMCKKSQVTKAMRQTVKGAFVFASFYGSWWKSTAPNLWGAIKENDLKLTDGTPVYDHLASKGIDELGCAIDRNNPTGFMAHVKEVDNILWYKKYPGYSKWKKDFYDDYCKNGYFDIYTGFRCQGHMNRKQCTNAPPQGSAFHILLWSFIEMQKEMRKRKMKSLLIGQIHDCALLDTHKDEVDGVIELFTTISTKRVKKHWDWIVCPLKVDVKKSAIDGNWFELQEV